MIIQIFRYHYMCLFMPLISCKVYNSTQNPHQQWVTSNIFRLSPLDRFSLDIASFKIQGSMVHMICPVFIVFWNSVASSLEQNCFPVPFPQTCQLTWVRINHLVQLQTRQKTHRFNTQTERKLIQNPSVNAKKPIMVVCPRDKKIQSENCLILFHKYFFFPATY